MGRPSNRARFQQARETTLGTLDPGSALANKAAKAFDNADPGEDADYRAWREARDTANANLLSHGYTQHLAG